ncbi:MAG: CPBP family intramembrane metalloprotease [Bacteroidales bacterium]|nr:CPBP family intramembrane metalloprotease [Bacteroidales bacterium]
MTKAISAFLCFFFYMALALGLATLWANAGHLNAGDNDPLVQPSPVVYGVSQLVCLVLTAVLLWAFRIVRRRPLQSGVRLGGKTWAMSLVSFLLIALGISIFITPFGLTDDGQMALFNAMKGNVLCLFLLTVAGPLFEELVFREGIVRNLIASKVHPLLAVLVSALLFGIVHGNLAQAVPAIILGLVLGVAYLLTGDIRLSGIMHICNNTLAILMLTFPETEAAIAALPTAGQFAVGGVMCLAGGAMMFSVCRPVLRRG